MYKRGLLSNYTPLFSENKHVGYRLCYWLIFIGGTVMYAKFLSRILTITGDMGNKIVT